MLERLVDILFPPRCFGCGAHLLRGERLARCCEACNHTVHRVESPKCLVCAMPRDAKTGSDEVCGRCLTDRPRFDGVEALWVYDGAIADAVRRAKVGGDPSSLFAVLDRSRDWFDEQQTRFQNWQWTTPPIHPTDLRRRGWDPSRAALLRSLSAGIQVGDPLVKVRRTTKQARLLRDARAAAMRRAFDCPTCVSGQWVVFDDVMTTGATLNEAARALRNGGATNVIGVVLARSV